MNVKSEFQQERAIELAEKTGNLETGYDSMVAFADRFAQTEDALAELEQVTGKTAARAVGRLKKEMEAFEPAVTFLGQVKSGKTTLVNAMAGWADLLPSDVNPWTSVVTSLHLQPGESRKDLGATFHMMTEGEWDRLVQKGGRLGEMADRAGSETELESIRQQIEMLREKSRRRLGRKFELLLGQEHEYGHFDKDLLERYICIGDDFYEDEDATVEEIHKGRFADITREAHLDLQSDRVPFRLCLRDTPGVNDTFMMREQVTINAVRSSRLCVVVLSAHQALTSVDMALIRMISSLQSRDVVIFVNRIDELSDPAVQIPEIEESIRKVLAEQKGPEDAQIVFGSALWANHVLADTVEDMNSTAAATLLKWAEGNPDTKDIEGSDEDLVWQLSGVPALNHIMSVRIVEKLGNPLLKKVASDAVSVASGQQAANKVMVEGDASADAMSMHQVKAEVTALAERCKDALVKDTNELIGTYQTRADRAHANFIERATAALVANLEENGDSKVWNYDPTGLRMLLRSAYSVFATRAQSLARKHYESAVGDIAELYFRAFGKAVEGIELSVPEVQEFPAPVAIAQTIALDFNDGWWVSWWRRTRGYKAFAKQFNALVTAETADFMAQLKTVQTAEIRDQLLHTLDAFFLQNKDIMLEIGTSTQTSRDGIRQICLGDEEHKRLQRLDDVIETLKQSSKLGMPEGSPQ